jgi:hypothetical protein
MELVCWLTFLCAGVEPVGSAPPTLQEQMTAIRIHRWLSPREKLERLARLDMKAVTEKDITAMLPPSIFSFGGWARTWVYDFGDGEDIRFPDQSVADVLPVILWKPWRVLPLWDHPGGKFLSQKDQSAEIRGQDMPHEEKIRRLVKLIHPGMTMKQVLHLFGETEAVLNGPYLRKLFLLDYSVAVTLDADANVAEAEVITDASARTPWGMLGLPSQQELRPQQEQVFNFIMGWCR